MYTVLANPSYVLLGFNARLLGLSAPGTDVVVDQVVPVSIFMVHGPSPFHPFEILISLSPFRNIDLPFTLSKY